MILKRRKKSFYLRVTYHNLFLCQKFPWCSYLVVGKYIVLRVYTVLISEGVYLLDKTEGLLFYPPIHKIIRVLDPFRSDHDTGSTGVVSRRWNLAITRNKQSSRYDILQLGRLWNRGRRSSFGVTDTPSWKHDKIL